MINPPRRNLPTPAEPWGRSVDTRLADLERQQSTQSETTTNALSAINATLTRLGAQVGEISALTTTLAEQQTALAGQQAQLSSAVDQLTAVVNGQISAETKTASQYVTYNGDPRDYAVVDFVIPEGYSKAYVMAVSSAAFDSTAAVNAAIYTRVGVEYSGQQAGQSVNGEIISISASYADIVNASVRRTFSCATTAQDITGLTVSGWVQTSVTVLYLR